MNFPNINKNGNFFPTGQSYNHNIIQYYDKTIPEVEIPLSLESFQSIRNRREVFAVNFSYVGVNVQRSRNALYNRGFFEGDIGIKQMLIQGFLWEKFFLKSKSYSRRTKKPKRWKQE